MKKLTAAVLIFLLLEACTVPVDRSEIENAKYPPSSTEEETISWIKVILSEVLKDPESLKLQCKPTRKGWARQYRDSQPKFGWLTRCLVNSKNSFGGYTGNQPYVFLRSSSGIEMLDESKFRSFEEHVGYTD